MITEDYCSYEVAKLLKEKGFLKDVDLRMTQNLSFYDNIGLHHNLNKYYNSLILDKIDFVVAPTHQMAMKWIRETYDIFIVIRRGLTGTGWVYSHEIYKDSQCLYAQYGASYDTYEEAVETALKYALENLI